MKHIPIDVLLWQTLSESVEMLICGLGPKLRKKYKIWKMYLHGKGDMTSYPPPWAFEIWYG